MFLVLSKTLDVLLSPLTWAMLLLLAGMVRRRSSIPFWSPLGALAILAFFSMEPVGNALMRRVELSAQRTDRKNATYDAVILLGGLLDERPTRWTEVPNYNDHVERLLATFDALRSGHARAAIISGGPVDPDAGVIEARVLASQLEQWGIDRSRLLIEDRSRNTRENALFSKQMVDAHHFKQLLLVTSAAHMPRAADCFHAVGLDIDTLPVDYQSYDPSLSHGSFIPRAGPLSSSVTALRELTGRWIYRLVGYGSG